MSGHDLYTLRLMQVVADLCELPDEQPITAARFRTVIAQLGAALGDVVAGYERELREVTVSQQQLAAAWHDLADELGLTAEDPEPSVRPA